MTQNSAAPSPLPRPPERTRPQVEKNHHNTGGGQKIFIIGAVQVTRPVAPQGQGSGCHKQKEKGACYLQPQNAAHPPKGFQESAHAARHALRRPPSRLPSNPRICLTRRLPTRRDARSLCILLSLPSLSRARCRRSSRLRSSHQLLAGHSPGNPQPNPQHSPYILGFHSVMMVAAEVFPPLFGLLSHMPT